MTGAAGDVLPPCLTVSGQTQDQRRLSDAFGEGASSDLADVVARPFIVMRNDHQDALSAGLAVSEFAPAGKSADEIRALWQWVQARLNSAVANHANSGGELAHRQFAEEAAAEADARWDACL